MKKALLVLAIGISIGAKAQKDTSGLATKIVDKFKTGYVRQNFKDPYSFQLLSIKYWVISKGEDLQTKITVDSTEVSQYYRYGFDKYEVSMPWSPAVKAKAKRIKEAKEQFDINKKALSEMIESEKTSFYCYGVSIECRGSNSYGGMVYSEIFSKYYPTTSILETLK